MIIWLFLNEFQFSTESLIIILHQELLPLSFSFFFIFITWTVLNTIEFCTTSLFNYSRSKSSSQKILLKMLQMQIKSVCNLKVFQTQSVLWQCCINVVKYNLHTEINGHFKGHKSKSLDLFQAKCFGWSLCHSPAESECTDAFCVSSCHFMKYVHIHKGSLHLHTFVRVQSLSHF